MQAAGAGIAVNMGCAWGLSPPEPSLSSYLSETKLVLVGVVERFLFHGVSPERPAELNRDFEQDSPGRRLDILVRRERVLMNALGTETPAVLRMVARTTLSGVRPQLGSARIFLISRVHRPERREQADPVFYPVRDSLPLSQEEEVVRLLREQNSRPGR
jgi:hypothetical protein